MIWTKHSQLALKLFRNSGWPDSFDLTLWKRKKSAREIPQIGRVADHLDPFCCQKCLDLGNGVDGALSQCKNQLWKQHYGPLPLGNHQEPSESLLDVLSVTSLSP